MKSTLQKLYKFFKLEAEHSYDNRAVIGGLERMLAPWEPEARLEGLPEELIHAVASRLRDYGRLSPASRRESLDGLWKRIKREAGEPIPDLTLPLPLPVRPDSPVSGGDRSNLKQVSVPPPSAHQPAAVAEAAAGRTPSAPTAPEPARSAAPENPPAAARTPTERCSVPPLTVAPAPRRHPPAPETPAAALNAPLTVLSGVGPKHASTLARLGLKSLGDMLYNFPRRYDDYSKLKTIRQLWYGEVVTVIGVVKSVNTRDMRGGRARMVEAIVSDGSGSLRAIWWNPYAAKRIHQDMQVALSGKVEQYLGRLVMSNPELEELDQQNLSTNRIVPIYPLTSHITQRWLRRLIYQVVSYWAPRMQDILPEAVRSAAGVMPLPQAILQAHFPDSLEQLQSARQRLAFDEIFLLQLGVLRQKHQWQDRTARRFEVSDDWLAAQVSRLPFPLTGAQQRSLADLRADLASGRPMNRLLQGDVGSGKTVIAALTAAITVRTPTERCSVPPLTVSAGAQAAIMAPTSILAEQHHRNLIGLLADVLPADSIRLMIGSTPESEKGEIRSGLESGAIKLVVGTHALIEDPVAFADLQLVVIDEQHRFGVEQRSILRSKGQNPHLLVMTATPIPRSLALTVYGDLDLSVMDEMPPGRLPVETQVFFPRERDRAYTLLRSQIDKGYQAFIIYPLVEETEPGERQAKEAGRSAVEEHARLQKEVFPKYRLGLLHGRLKPDEKDAVMGEFRDRKLDILVSTSVVEVGVDVPNATVMIIEGADRFGLAQLHQFRGRVGRSPAQSYCILIPETPDAVENARLMAMTETTDGFKLAELDLSQRGPGDFLGTRQAGFSELRMASLTDVRLIEKARGHAQELFERDADLQQPEHARLVSALNRFWGMEQGDIS